MSSWLLETINIVHRRKIFCQGTLWGFPWTFDERSQIDSLFHRTRTRKRLQRARGESDKVLIWAKSINARSWLRTLSIFTPSYYPTTLSWILVVPPFPVLQQILLQFHYQSFYPKTQILFTYRIISLASLENWPTAWMISISLTWQVKPSLDWLNWWSQLAGSLSKLYANAGLEVGLRMTKKNALLTPKIKDHLHEDAKTFYLLEDWALDSEISEHTNLLRHFYEYHKYCSRSAYKISSLSAVTDNQVCCPEKCLGFQYE